MTNIAPSGADRLLQVPVTTNTTLQFYRLRTPAQ